MLDDLTKRRINSLRQILVGKLPDPKAQVEQITNGLIYKFMNDMDEEAITLGGNATYFSGKYQKYSWKNLLNSKTDGSKRVELYSEAIKEMYKNENLPELFRDIFKDSFLPFQDPSTLSKFLKEINEFHYANSEKLGDAFEYLLSFMGSQGDAGQFRTPRHIIDFIVEIINPKKDETILDPACGTAGFLISSYKHILNQNTKKNLGDKLTAFDRKKIGENLNGYDISPDMVKMSLVNMYLHKFTNPKINEYDTLSSEDRWNEYYDVILANPPFFSPKGGITPHNRFGVKSNKAEVLFVDYINEHLKPNGRAGIIVPDGINYQPSKSYESLRKIFFKNLIGIISLPTGVFQPYSTVKTSILIIDKKKSKDLNNIFYLEIENDGYTLSSSRKESSKNDIPESLELINSFLNNNGELNSKKNKIKFFVISKEKIKENNYSLNINNYNLIDDEVKKTGLIKLGNLIEESKERHDGSKENILTVSNKYGFIKSDEYFKHRVASKNIENYKIVKSNYFAYNPARVNIGSIALQNKYSKGQVSPMYTVFKISNKNKILEEFLIEILKTSYSNKLINKYAKGTIRQILKFEDLCKILIPDLSLDEQKNIITACNAYRTSINSAQNIIDNYFPTVSYDGYPLITLENLIVSTEYGSSKKALEKGKIPVLRMGNIKNGELDFEDLVYTNDDTEINKLNLVDGDILFNRTNSPELVGKSAIYRSQMKSIFAGYLIRVKVNKEKILPEFLNIFLNSSEGKKLHNQNKSVSGNQANINATKLKNYKIPLPEISKQKQIVEEINEEKKIIYNNKKVIEIFKNKIENLFKKYLD